MGLIDWIAAHPRLLCVIVLFWFIAIVDTELTKYKSTHPETQEQRNEQSAAAQRKRFEIQAEHFSYVCKNVKNVKVADLTTHDQELINTCNADDKMDALAKMEYLSPPTWWEKLRGMIE